MTDQPPKRKPKRSFTPEEREKANRVRKARAEARDLERALKAEAELAAVEEDLRQFDEDDPQVTAHDELKAIKVLRKQMDSLDENTAQRAAFKVLEYAKGRPAQQQEEQRDVRIVLETAFVPPEEIARTFDPATVPPPPSINDDDD